MLRSVLPFWVKMPLFIDGSFEKPLYGKMNLSFVNVLILWPLTDELSFIPG